MQETTTHRWMYACVEELVAYDETKRSVYCTKCMWCQIEIYTDMEIKAVQ